MDCFVASIPQDEAVELKGNATSTRDPKDLHYYEPANGHGLKHDPFNAIIAPRPIGWISSRDARGDVNLAPYSFFNAFNYHPPIIGFSSTAWKDSVAEHPGDRRVRLESRDHGSGAADERDRRACRPRRQRIRRRRA